MNLPKATPSMLALVVANLVPLVGVLLLDWDARVIVLLYWTENIILGAYNVLKMALLKVESPALNLGKIFAIPFFCLHFGGFCAVHGLFLLLLLKVGGEPKSLFPGDPWPCHFVFLQLLFGVIAQLWREHPAGMQWPVLCLFVSHGISFVHNYLLKKEYASLTLRQLMGQPYKRIVILHVAIIAGGALIMALGSPRPLLSILVFLKIWLDIYLHVKEHKTNKARRAPS